MRRPAGALSSVHSGAAAVRVVVVTAGALAVAVVPSAGLWSSVALVGAVTAAVAPRRVGSVLFVVAIVLAWAGAYARGAAPPAATVVVLAVLVHLVQSATALAAVVPLDAHLSPAAAARWTVAALPGLAAAVVVGVAAGVVGRLPGSPLLDLVGAAGAVLAVAALAVLIRRAGGGGADTARTRSSSGS